MSRTKVCTGMCSMLRLRMVPTIRVGRRSPCACMYCVAQPGPYSLWKLCRTMASATWRLSTSFQRPLRSICWSGEMRVACVAQPPLTRTSPVAMAARRPRARIFMVLLKERRGRASVCRDLGDAGATDGSRGAHRAYPPRVWIDLVGDEQLSFAGADPSSAPCHIARTVYETRRWTDSAVAELRLTAELLDLGVSLRCAPGRAARAAGNETAVANSSR